jgi:hypothetical protein
MFALAIPVILAADAKLYAREFQAWSRPIR